MTELKRSCENCGNRACATSLVAIRYDECIRSVYQTHWRPRFDMLPPLQDGEHKSIVGIAADEHKRIAGALKRGELLPLVDYNITEAYAVNRLILHTDQLILYSTELDVYVLGVTHYGTSWEYVSTEFEF